MLYFHQQCLRVLISSPPRQHVFFSTFFIIPILAGVEVGTQFWFWFTFPWRLMMLNMFSWASWSFVYLWENVYSNPCPCLHWATCVFITCCKNSLYILDSRSFYQLYALQILSPSLWVIYSLALSYFNPFKSHDTVGWGNSWKTCLGFHS